MELSEDEIYEKHGEHCGHCDWNTLLPFECEWTCISCRFNLIKGKPELSKIQRKNINFIVRLKFAEHNFFAFV